MKRFLVISAVALALAGCGSTQGDRALVGGAMGATAGAVIGGLATGRAGGAVAGGLIGAAGGAIVGAATTPQPEVQCYYSRYYGRRVCREVVY
ncbi:hypothetical protein GCM10007036_36110 [Alsobacter metallidurans]|uniref:Lipoprotein n=1 Tax=Alsobacter metallidurans TaxID=340221 RepID=A0A917IAW2_9HYPH|nr:bacteriocin [Alsobacter metallidurans]GGH27537.1 hypothetical protein GCM10007036_36110 [Alsobacter metallidurans]